jgi:hypothetical protein
MTKITPLNNITNLQDTSTSQTLINANSGFITTAVNNTLSLDGSTPNQMQAPLDMNSNKVINSVFSLASFVNSSPSNGDLWYDGTHLNFRTGGVTHVIV